MPEYLAVDACENFLTHTFEELIGKLRSFLCMVVVSKVYI